MEKQNPFSYTKDAPLVTLSSRNREAFYHLQTLGITALPASEGIMEIGSGQGGVTQALRALAPDAPFIAIDLDTDPTVQEAAEKNRAQFFGQDTTTMSPNELNNLLQAHTITTIVAFRIPAVVAYDMIHKLTQIGFEGQLAFSVIELPQEADGLRKVAQLTSHIRNDMQTFSENRMMTEYGYRITFPLVEKEEVA